MRIGQISSPTSLSKAIMNDRWDQAIAIARSNPEKAKVWGWRQGFFEGQDSNVLPLHECLVGNGPVDLVHALITAYPKGVRQQESSYQRLPLHCACRKNANPRVVQLLLEADAKAALVADSLGRLPCEYRFVSERGVLGNSLVNIVCVCMWKSHHSNYLFYFSNLACAQCTTLYPMAPMMRLSIYCSSFTRIPHGVATIVVGHRKFSADFVQFKMGFSFWF